MFIVVRGLNCGFVFFGFFFVGVCVWVGFGVGGLWGFYGWGKLVWKMVWRGEDGERVDNWWVLFYGVVVLVWVWRRREKGGERVVWWKVVVEDIMICVWGVMVLEERGCEIFVWLEVYLIFVFVFFCVMCVLLGMGVLVDRLLVYKLCGGGWKRCLGVNDGIMDFWSLLRDVI